MVSATIGATTSTATYDALGRMVETVSGGTTTQFAYSPLGTQYAVEQNGTLLRGMVPLPGGDMAVYNSSGLNYVRRADWLGSSRLTTTWAHAVYSKDAYAPFGEPYDETSTTDRSFTGQGSDLTQNQGIYDFEFRKLDTTAGRWLSPDPSGWGAVDLTNPQTLNRYAYVNNSPLTNVDPLGLAPRYFYLMYCVPPPCAKNNDCGNKNPDQPSCSEIIIYVPDNGVIPQQGQLWTGPGIGTGAYVKAIKPVVPKKPCHGTFSFAGAEADAGGGGAFLGGITEHDPVDGNTHGSLAEGWLGGEGPMLGLGKITSSTDKSIFSGIFGFFGAGITTGPLAGIQVGWAGGSGWSGLYVEGHVGPVAFGTGAYSLSSCKAGG